MDSKRKMNLLINLKKYPFGRAVHFFFNLDQFPRATDTVSYVINEQNAFGHTYSRDNLMIKDNTIGDVVNRKLMGLPVNLTGDLPSRK